MSDYDDALIIDNDRSCWLCSAGAAGCWAAVVLVDPQGRDSFAIVDMGALDNQAEMFYPEARDIQHEQLGYLPADVFVRVWSVR
jgi:hypothetical protein